jgi:diguanylate cyclase (GGDEF)-like protein/PAS domain S-box-containing protein
MAEIKRMKSENEGFPALSPTEAALRKSEERLRRITDNMVDLVIQVDGEAAVGFVSPSVTRVLGYEIRDLIGRKVTDFIHPDDLERSLGILARTDMTGENKTEHRVRHRDGRFLWFEFVGRTILDERGQFVGAVLGGRDITEKKEMSEELRKSEKKFRALTDSTAVAIFVVQGERFRYINCAFTELTGYAMADLEGMRFWEIVAPEMREIVRARGQARQRGEPVPPRYELRLVTRSGEEKTVDFAAAFIEFENKPALIGSAVDITERKNKEEALRLSEERYRTILETIEDGYFEVDLKGNIIFASDPFLKIAGLDRETLLGMNYHQYTRKEDCPKIEESFFKVYSTGESLKGLLWEAVRMDGSRVHVETSVSLVRDAGGKPAGFRGIVRDVSERRKSEEKVRWLAHHDVLTGLPNRALFYERAAMILAQAKRRKGRFGMMLLDLDRFKEINDRFGHDAGDRVLVEASDRLKKVLRDVDTVARIGGDEFVVLLPEVADELNAGQVAERIAAAFGTPVAVGEEEIPVSFTIGTALYPDDGQDIDAILRRADQAMYRGKPRRNGAP